MADLNTVTGERNTAQQELSQWRLFEMSPDKIRENLARLRTVERERDVYTTENKALSRKLANIASLRRPSRCCRNVSSALARKAP